MNEWPADRIRPFNTSRFDVVHNLLVAGDDLGNYHGFMAAQVSKISTRLGLVDSVDKAFFDQLSCRYRCVTKLGALIEHHVPFEGSIFDVVMRAYEALIFG